MIERLINEDTQFLANLFRWAGPAGAYEAINTYRRKQSRIPDMVIVDLIRSLSDWNLLLARQKIADISARSFSACARVQNENERDALYEKILNKFALVCVNSINEVYTLAINTRSETLKKKLVVREILTHLYQAATKFDKEKIYDSLYQLERQWLFSKDLMAADMANSMMKDYEGFLDFGFRSITYAVTTLCVHTEMKVDSLKFLAHLLDDAFALSDKTNKDAPYLIIMLCARALQMGSQDVWQLLLNNLKRIITAQNVLDRFNHQQNSSAQTQCEDLVATYPEIISQLITTSLKILNDCYYREFTGDEVDCPVRYIKPMLRKLEVAGTSAVEESLNAANILQELAQASPCVPAASPAKSHNKQKSNSKKKTADKKRQRAGSEGLFAPYQAPEGINDSAIAASLSPQAEPAQDSEPSKKSKAESAAVSTTTTAAFFPTLKAASAPSPETTATKVTRARKKK